MDARESLARYRDIGWDIEALQCEQEKIKGLLHRLSPTARSTRVQGGPLPVYGAKVDKLVDLDREIEKQLARLRDDRRDIVARIERLPNARHRRVLKLKYLSGLTDTQIARQIGHDERHVRRLIRAALEAFDDKSKEEAT